MTVVCAESRDLSILRLNMSSTIPKAILDMEYRSHIATAGEQYQNIEYYIDIGKQFIRFPVQRSASVAKGLSTDAKLLLPDDEIPQTTQTHAL